MRGSICTFAPRHDANDVILVGAASGAQSFWGLRPNFERCRCASDTFGQSSPSFRTMPANLGPIQPSSSESDQTTVDVEEDLAMLASCCSRRPICPSVLQGSSNLSCCTLSARDALTNISTGEASRCRPGLGYSVVPDQACSSTPPRGAKMQTEPRGQPPIRTTHTTRAAGSPQTPRQTGPKRRSRT